MILGKSISEDKLKSVIERLEKYPCTLSCYSSMYELNGARQMKENMLRLIKEELL